MGEPSRAACAALGAVALALVAGCAAAPTPRALPLAATSTMLLTTTSPEDLPSAPPEYVDPAVAEPPGGQPGTGSVFLWSRAPGPKTRFGPVDAARLRRIVATDIEVNRTDIGVAVTLRSPARARALADRVRAGLPSGITRYRDAGDAVVVLGSTVMLRGLPDAAAQRTARRLLARAGGQVLVEGDRFGEGAVVADLSCRPSAFGRARTAAGDLADYAALPSQLFLRPPWADPPLTPAERLARSTYVRFQDAVERAADRDPVTAELGFRYRRALVTGDTDGQRRLRHRIAARRHELAPRRLAGPYDRRTLRRLRAQPPGLRGWPRWAARTGARMGQLPRERRAGEWVATPRHHLAAILTVRLEDRLDIAGFLPGGHLAPSLAALVVYLDRAGCRDVRYRLLDWDDVRVD